MIRNSLVPFVRKLNSDNDLFIFFLFDKALSDITKDVYVYAYVMPQGSPYYNVFEVESGIELLQGCLSDILLSRVDVYVILWGDLTLSALMLCSLPSLGTFCYSAQK